MLDDIGGSKKRMGRSSDNTIKSTWSLVTPNYAYTVVLSHGFALIVGFLINVWTLLVSHTFQDFCFDCVLEPFPTLLKVSVSRVNFVVHNFIVFQLQPVRKYKNVEDHWAGPRTICLKGGIPIDRSTAEGNAPVWFFGCRLIVTHSFAKTST